MSHLLNNVTFAHKWHICPIMSHLPNNVTFAHKCHICPKMSHLLINGTFAQKISHLPINSTFAHKMFCPSSFIYLSFSVESLYGVSNNRVGVRWIFWTYFKIFTPSVINGGVRRAPMLSLQTPYTLSTENNNEIKLLGRNITFFLCTVNARGYRVSS